MSRLESTRITYLCYVSYRKYPGVYRKIIDIVNAWRSMGREVDLVILNPYRNAVEESETGKGADYYVQFSRFNLMTAGFIDFQAAAFVKKNLRKLIPADRVLYVRNSMFLYHILKHIPNAKIGEINSNEFLEMRSYKSVKGRLYNAAFNSFAGKLLNLFSGLVCISRELAIAYRSHNPNTIYIANSINADRFAAYKKQPEPSERIRFAFIGTPDRQWHGLEEVLKLPELDPSFEVHLIGYEDVPTSEEKRIFSHGYMHQSDYVKIFQTCHIGVGSLAMYTIDMHDSSSLKVREYLAMGMPVLLSSRDTAFYRNDEYQPGEFICTLPNIPDTLQQNAEKVRAFAHQYKDFVVPDREISELVDVSTIEAKRLSFIAQAAQSRADRSAADTPR